MDVKLAQDNQALEKIAPILRQLRTQFSQTALIEKIRQQQESGYQIAYVEQDGQVLCVAGFVIGEKLAWGKHIYVDDLVTDEQYRSTGAGGHMLAWLKNYARDNQCKQIHLDSGVQRFPAHRFYLNHGFNIASHHFSIT